MNFSFLFADKGTHKLSSGSYLCDYNRPSMLCFHVERPEEHQTQKKNVLLKI